MAEEINYQSLGKKKILVAEDVELNQYLARHIMESWGFEVEIANNGKEALDMVTRNEYDLVLMDIQMPEMDGMEATQNIRLLSDPHKASIPIVALTANALRGDSDKYLSVGMNDYLSKPFDESKLFLIISKNLNGKSRPEAANGVQQKEEMSFIAAPDQKLYDLSMVEAISGGDAQFVKKMIQLFLDTMPQALTDLEAELKLQKWETVGKLAHKMKSTIDSMGIASLKQDIRTIEHGGKHQTGLELVPELVARVRTVMEACMEQVKKDYGL
jgi:CheY-like chemotaxis protein